MKKAISIVFLLLLCTFCLPASEYEIRGPQGRLDWKVTLPEDFNPETDHCPMVILMHGVFSRKDHNPIKVLAEGLAEAGIASISFDFDGHGKSEGRMQDMTVEKEIADAMAILEYVKTLPYVSRIGFLGHSQGGVIASMMAGRLAAAGSDVPVSMALLAPGSIIKYACQIGRFFSASFDPEDPPEYVRCFVVKKLGREYMQQTQNLEIYETAAAYKGNVCLIHGNKDKIVPLWCSECYKTIYGDRAELAIIDGENHRMTRHRDQVVAKTVEFFKSVF